MPIKDPERRNKLRKERGETRYVSKSKDPEGHKKRMERQRARRAFDKKHGKAARQGSDIGHVKALAKGGSNKDGTRVMSRKANRASGGAMSKPGTKKKKA